MKYNLSVLGSFESLLHRFKSITYTPAKSTERTTKLNILALNWRCMLHPQAGGAEENLFQQAQCWIKEGHNVTVFTSKPDDEYLQGSNKLLDDVRILRYGGRFTIYIFAFLYVLLNGHRYDVILDVSNGIPFFTPLVTNKPVTLLIHHVHEEQWFEEFPSFIAHFGWFLERKVVKWLYKNKPIISVSPSTEQSLIAMGYNPRNISVVFNGLNISTPPFVYSRHHPHIAYVGRVKAYKRLDLLVQATKKLKEQYPHILLDIAGGGDYINELTQLVDDLGLQSNVRIHGYVSNDQKIEILSKARVYATPSMQEGWGIAVLEANAYGCPAVAYNVPGLSAAIPPNETGLLADDDEDFVNCIARLLEDDDLLNRLSDGAVYWASLFKWEDSAETTLSIMRSA